MVQHLALFAGLVASCSDANLPPQPNFRALIPPPSEAFFAGLQDSLHPARREAEALAEYLNRVWNSETLRNDPDNALGLLTVIAQFDCALLGLNPKPTAWQALELVRAYRPVLALVRQRIKQVEADPVRFNRVPLGPGQLDQLPAQLHRMNLRIEKQYYSLFARVA